VIAAGGGNKYNNQYYPRIDSKLIAFALPREGDGRLVSAVRRENYKGIEEKLPAAVAPQPVAFSHKAHAANRCVMCHTGALKAARAGLPGATQCRTCHPQRSAQPIEWVRVYQLPGYVFFRHDVHAKVGCAGCHGPVQTREVLAKEVSTSMTFCVGCHQERKASTGCSVCHEIGQ
jgi:predicted CXXCH cytochrome family protein